MKFHHWISSRDFCTKAFLEKLLIAVNIWNGELSVQLWSYWIILSRCHSDQRSTYDLPWHEQQNWVFTKFENFCLLSLLCWSYERARLKDWLITSKEKKTSFYFKHLKICIIIDSFRCISSNFRRLKFKFFFGEHALGPPSCLALALSRFHVFTFSPLLKNPLRGPCFNFSSMFRVRYTKR